MAKRYTRRELRQPDEFISFWEHAYNTARASARPLAIGIGATLIIFIATGFYLRHRHSKALEASRRLGHAIQIYSAKLKTEEPASVSDDSDDIPRFGTAGERQQAVVKELTEIESSYRGSPAGLDALLVRAGVLLDAHKYDEAISAYGDFLAQSNSQDRLRGLAREGRGYAFEGAARLREALEEFRKLEGESPLYRERARYHQARILEKTGDRAGATKLYREVLAQQARGTLREQASARLASLRTEKPPQGEK